MLIHDYFLDATRKMNPEDLVIYNVGLGIQPFSGYSYGYDCRHYYLMEYIIKGTGFFELDGKTYQVNSQEGYLIPPNTQFKTTAGEKGVSTCWIGFYGPHIEQYLRDARLFTKNTPVFHYANSSLLESMISNLYQKAQNPMVSNATLISCFYQLLGQLADDKMAETQNVKSLSYYEKCRYYIAQNIFNKPTVEQLTLEFDISSSQLYRSFKTCCGLSPKQYIDKEKIAKACELIRTTTLSFHQIALLLGFEHDASFYQTFKRVVGVRPSDIRHENITHHSYPDNSDISRVFK